MRPYHHKGRLETLQTLDDFKDGLRLQRPVNKLLVNLLTHLVIVRLQHITCGSLPVIGELQRGVRGLQTPPGRIKCIICIQLPDKLTNSF